MDPALLKHAPRLGALGATAVHSSFYERRHKDRWVPYGHSQVHDTFFARRHGQNWMPYGALGHSQVHSTYYSRLRGQNWVPYGDFVYKPVTDNLEVMPAVSSEAYGALGQEAASAYTFGNVLMAGVIGFMFGQFAGEHFERFWARRTGGQRG